MATQDISLAAAQEQVIRQMLDKWQEQGKIKSDVEYNLLLNQYMERVAAGAPIMNITPVTGVVDADQITETFEGFEVDVMSAYTAINAIGETINKHKMLNQSVLNTIELDIKNMDDKLDEYDARLGINGAQGLYIQRFRDSNSSADWDSSFTDRSGTLLAPAYKCSLDVEMEALQLPLVSWSNQLIGPSGVHLATIRKTIQFGSGFITLQNPEHTIDKAIDESMETFWSESILSDAPFAVEQDIAFYTNGQVETLTVKNGAICMAEIDFDYMSQISQITLTPFTEYPMRLEAILYWDEETSQWNSIVSPQAILNGQYFTTTISYEFPEITTKHLQIILNQIHYVKADYVISSKEERNKALWLKAAADTSVPVTYKNKAIYDNRGEEYPAWTSFMSKIKKQHIELETFAETFNEDINYTLSKYQYDYGLYNINAYRNEYQDRGIYVSKALPATGVTRAVRITVEEDHPTIKDVGVITDIEYSVTDGQNWYPIVPDNKDIIEAELLIPDRVVNGATICTTRFTPLLTIMPVVKKNGLPLMPQADFTMNVREVSIKSYDKSAVYTISYKPFDDYKTVDFLAQIPRTNGKLDLSKMQRSVETYGGTDDGGYLTLKYTPFVDRERLAALAADPTWNPTYVQSAYFPINVHVVDAGGLHIDQLLSGSDARAVSLTNMTNYFDPESKNLQEFSEAKLNYQYQVIGNQIQFNTPLPANTKIIVEYPFLVSEIKVKAIMRRNSHLYQGITPILHEYIVSFETLS